MTTTYFESKREIDKKIKFRKRECCINCNSSDLYPVWQGKFSDEPIRNFIQKHSYSEDVLKILGEETFSLVSCQNCRTMFYQNILTREFFNLLYSQWINDTQIKNLESEVRANKKPERLFEISRQLIISFVHPLEHINAFISKTLIKICSKAGFVPIKPIPAHAKTSLIDIIRTEISRFVQPGSNSMYFQLCKA